MDERAVVPFTAGNFPDGGYCVPNSSGNKQAFFMQGRAHYFYWFTDDERFRKVAKIPGDNHHGRFTPGNSSNQ